MGFYDELAADVTAIIDELGGTVTLERVSDAGGPIDASKPWLGQKRGTTQRQLRAAVVPVSDERINGTSIKVGDAVAYIAGATVNAVDVGDVLIIAGRRRSIESLERIIPDSNNLLLVEAIVR